VDNLNGDDNNNGDQATPFGTIGTALMNAASGDTVNVVGQVCGGIPFGYTDDSNQQNHETFPLLIHSGVTVKGVLGQGSSGIYVWTVHGGAGIPAALFQFDDSQGDNLNAALKKMALIGGKKGILIQATSGGTVSPTIGTVTFSHNTQGIHVLAQDDGVATVTIKNCTITDGLPVLDPLTCPGLMGPAAVGMQYGIRLRAVEPQGGGPGTIAATVDNLSTTGLFSRSAGPDYESLVFLTSNGRDHLQHVISSFDDISKIDLTFNGGILDGNAASGPDRGWLKGIKAELKTPSNDGQARHDYVARFLVTLNGTLIKDFREQGILATNEDDSRGQFVLNGQTAVTGTGSQLSGRGSFAVGAGIYIFSGEGYMSLEGTDATVTGNHNDGIFLGSLASDPDSAMKWPVGAWIGLKSVGIHNNLGNGIHFSSQSGIVGGTWHHLSTGEKVITIPPPTLNFFPDPTLHFGQGFVDRCAISNNGSGNGGDGGDSGILMKLIGDGAGISGTVGTVRIVNDFIWNNFTHGIFFVNNDTQDSPILAAPVVHCTVAGNEGTDNMNVEFLSGSSPSNITYQWVVSTPNASEELWTRIYNSIFQMKTGGQNPLPDFGAELEQKVLALDTGNYNPNTKIYATALRLVISPNGPQGFFNDPLNNSFDSPFLGPIDWTSTLPNQFFLNLNGQNILDFKDKSKPDLGGLTIEEASHDYRNQPRPSIFADRDKGADEIQ